MTFAQRVATMSIVAELNDPKFNVNQFLEIDDYFIGFEKERELYYKEKEAKRKKQEEARDILFKQRIEIQKNGLK